MSTPNRGLISWVVLTQGSRPLQLAAAIRSIRDDSPSAPVVVVANGCRLPALGEGVTVVESAIDLGVPGGRNLGASHTATALIGFLDDDAEVRQGVHDKVLAAFAADDRLGAVSLRLVDEDGDSARRHVPRPRGAGAKESGEVALFLGGASVIRRRAFDEVGGYFDDLRYGHEEVELCWRLVDAGWRIRYLADACVFHPRTEIARHADGWRLTGRNRVMVARRTLPWPVGLLHTSFWLLAGSVRAARENSARSYLSGWWSGWRHPVDRRPISWRGVWRLTRLGRPPII